MSPSRGGDARARDAETRRARVDGDVGAHRGVVGRSGARVGDCEPDGGADARPPTRVLDGSMGHELKARGLSESFATAMLANAQQPELVTSIHAEYVAAGCDVLTTNSFLLTPAALAKYGGGELAPLLHASCECARAATVA